MYSEVLLTKNSKQAANLVNRSGGFAKEIICAGNETPDSNLHMYVLVEFCEMYTDKRFFRNYPSRHGWESMKPIENT